MASFNKSHYYYIVDFLNLAAPAKTANAVEEKPDLKKTEKSKGSKEDIKPSSQQKPVSKKDGRTRL